MTTHREGSLVPESGVYEVIHDKKQHDVQRHEVTCIKGKRFPPCRGCGKDVEFRAVRIALHIGDHQHFS
jgi:hypothetical protein